MQLHESEVSCGVGQLSGLSGAGTILSRLEAFQRSAYNGEGFLGQSSEAECDCECKSCKSCKTKEELPPLCFAFIVFSDVDGRSPGAQLAALIKTKKWGKVAATAAVQNPNSENKIKVWVWQPNTIFVKWCANM